MLLKPPNIVVCRDVAFSIETEGNLVMSMQERNPMGHVGGAKVT